MIAGQLELIMSANIAKLATDLAGARSVVTDTMGTIESSVASAKSALAGLGIGIGAGYFVSLIKGSIDAADHLEHLTKSTSLTVEQLAGLKLVAQESGTNLDGLAKGLDKMSVAMGKDPEKFRALGVTAKDNKEAFKQFADIFNLLPDVQMRNALAQAVFNKSWAEIAPALALGGEKLGEVMDKGAKLSGVTEEMTARAHDFNVKLAEIGTSADGAKTRLAGGLLPALTALVDNFTLVRDITASVVAAKVAGWASEAAVALYKTVGANMATAAATLATAEANALATGTAVALTTARIAEMRAAAAAAGGEVALTIVTTGLVPMQAQAALAAEAHAVALDALAVASKTASVTSGIAAGALGLLSGPIGWITLALGLGATAWSLWGKSSSDAVNSANDAVARGLEIAQRYQKEAKFGTGDIGDLKIALDAVDKKILGLSMPGKQPLNATVQLAGLRMESMTLLVALDKATNKTNELTEAQKKAAAAAAAFLGTDKQGKVGAVSDWTPRDEEMYKARVAAAKELEQAEQDRQKVADSADASFFRAMKEFDTFTENQNKLLEQQPKVGKI